MKLRKLFAALLAVALLLGCLPFAASAANAPSVLYVGEKDKSDDNLIDKYDSEGYVLVYAIDRDSHAYYTVTKEEGVGYVLTFYNDYTMSEMVDNRSAYCGVYCDGDLTIRLASSMTETDEGWVEGCVTFDANDEQYKCKDTIGWLVDGQLTIEKATKDENGNPFTKPVSANLVINGSKAKSESDDGSIGICAQTLMLHDVNVTACGGYSGVKAEEALVMLDSTLNTNTAPDMKEDDVNLFKYSIQTDHFIQSSGAVCAVGDVDIESYYLDGGSHQFDQTVVVYARNYKFAEETYEGYWSDTFKLFRNTDLIPSCMKVSVGSTVAKIDGNELRLNRRGSTLLALTIRCGSGLIVMDVRDVSCRLMWWQWIPYILSFAWTDAIFK